MDVSAQLADEELETSASYGHHHYHQPDEYHGGHHSQSDHHQPHTHSQSYSHSQQHSSSDDHDFYRNQHHRHHYSGHHHHHNHQHHNNHVCTIKIFHDESVRSTIKMNYQFFWNPNYWKVHNHHDHHHDDYYDHYHHANYHHNHYKGILSVWKCFLLYLVIKIRIEVNFLSRT